MRFIRFTLLGLTLLLLTLTIAIGENKLVTFSSPQSESVHNSVTNSNVTLLNINRLPPPESVPLESSSQPRPLTEDQKNDLLEELEETSEVPDILLRNRTISGPSNGTELDVNITQDNNTVYQSTVPKRSLIQTSDKPSLMVLANRTLAPSDAHYTMESSIANKNGTVFYVGNWFAARSPDHGISWAYIIPTSPNVMPDFCCDQDTIFDPKHGIFIWYLQGIKDIRTGENRIKIGVSHDTRDWSFITFKASHINSTWINQQSDYPNLSLSNKYLYITMNMIQHHPSEDPEFLRPIILRILLDDLARTDANIGPAYEYYDDTSLPNSSHTFTPIQGASDKMYWAIHLSNDKMRIYEWPDSLPRTAVKIFDRSVPAWTPLNRLEGECPGPDGNNWCVRGMSKIRGAFMSNDTIGFLWDANKGGKSINNATFPFPYIDAATFDTDDNMTYSGRPYLWSPDFAWMYGFASPDELGNVAIQAFYGGGDYYPSIAAGVGNDFKSPTLPWQMMRLVNGTDGPGTFNDSPAWGDYIRVRPFNGQGPGWIGSGWSLQGGKLPQDAQPRYFEFALDSLKKN